MSAADRIEARRRRLEALPPTPVERLRTTVLGWGWGVPMRATLHDGSVREGYVKFRSRQRGFTLSDSIDTIAFGDVEKVEPL